MGEFDGVVDQIDHHLPEPGGIAENPGRNGRFHIQSHIHVLLVSLQGHQIHGTFQHGRQVELRLLQLKLTGFDFGKIQDVVDESQQHFPGEPDLPQVVGLLLVEVRFRHELRCGEDGMDGSPDLMAGIGQELALGFGGFLRVIPGADQPHLQPFLGGDVPHHDQKAAVHFRRDGQEGQSDPAVGGSPAGQPQNQAMGSGPVGHETGQPRGPGLEVGRVDQGVEAFQRSLTDAGHPTEGFVAVPYLGFLTDIGDALDMILEGFGEGQTVECPGHYILEDGSQDLRGFRQDFLRADGFDEIGTDAEFPGLHHTFLPGQGG